MSERSPADIVLRYLVGSTGYRSAQRLEFAEVLSQRPPEVIASLITDAHLGGLAVEPLTEVDSPSSRQVGILLMKELRLRSAFHGHLQHELRHLGDCLSRCSDVPAVAVLKGPALWGVAYATPSERQARDLDLYVPNEQDRNRLCDVLEQEGFVGMQFEVDGRGPRDCVAEGGEYSLPPYQITRHFDVSSDIAEGLQSSDIGSAGACGIHQIDGAPVVTVDMEIHKALYCGLDGTQPAPPPAELVPNPGIRGILVLNSEHLLAYSAVKLSLEVLAACAGPTDLKFHKLLADLVRVLSRATQDDLRGAIRAARAWGSMHDFLDALRLASPLVPERPLMSLPDIDDVPSLETMVQAVIGARFPSMAPGHDGIADLVSGGVSVEVKE